MAVSSLVGILQNSQTLGQVRTQFFSQSDSQGLLCHVKICYLFHCFVGQISLSQWGT